MKTTWSTLFLITLYVSLYSQSLQPLEIGKKFDFESKILNETREILIYEPEATENYKEFPVIYLLDAESNFSLTKGIIENLQRSEILPQVILIGIPNKGFQREYNLSPTHLDVEYMETGGGPDFLNFLKDELIPHIDKNFATTEHRTIIGHSIGALFNLFALHKEEALFDNYLNISPSLWWEKGEYANLLKKEIPNKQFEREKRVFMSMADEGVVHGSDGKLMLDKYIELSDYFNGLRMPYLNVKRLDFADENHLTTVVKSTYHGLSYLYEDWNLDRFYSNNDFEGLKTELSKLSAKYGFDVPPSYSVVNIGRNAFNNNEFDKAIEIYKFGLKYYPKGLQMNAFLGNALDEKGDFNGAKQAFENTLSIAKSTNSPMTSWVERRLTEVSKKIHN